MYRRDHRAIGGDSTCQPSTDSNHHHINHVNHVDHHDHINHNDLTS
jgi:hypothetical protein